MLSIIYRYRFRLLFFYFVYAAFLYFRHYTLTCDPMFWKTTVSGDDDINFGSLPPQISVADENAIHPVWLLSSICLAIVRLDYHLQWSLLRSAHFGHVIVEKTRSRRGYAAPVNSSSLGSVRLGLHDSIASVDSLPSLCDNMLELRSASSSAALGSTFPGGHRGFECYAIIRVFCACIYLRHAFSIADLRHILCIHAALGIM